MVNARRQEISRSICSTGSLECDRTGAEVKEEPAKEEEEEEEEELAREALPRGKRV
jgi:hypothetical protein